MTDDAAGTTATLATAAHGDTLPVIRPGRGHVAGLDGLRGVAVLAVMVFHHYHFSDGARHAWSGGFLGVDIFFVLSGFLITGLLVAEHDATDRIRLTAFWSRRARRLLPALFVVVATTALAARWIVRRPDLAALRVDAWFTLGYLQNWHHRQPGSPLGHMWSLAVEEQWYLVWPVVVAVVLRARQRLDVVIGIGIVASAATSWWLAESFGTDRAYNGTDARAQQLLVGALLAVVLQRTPALTRRAVQYLDVAAVVAGIALVIAFLTATTSDAWYHHGGMVLVAVLAATIVAACCVETPVASRALAAAPLRVVGIVSYGLYLFHIPVYAWLTPHRTGLDSIALLGARVATTAVVAAGSYLLVERPVRRSNLWGIRLVGAVVVGAVATVACVTIGTSGSGPIPGIPSATAHALTTISADTPAGVDNVLVYGDTSAFLLAQHTPGGFRGRTIRGAAYGRLGCGILDGLPVFGDAPVPTAHECADTTTTFRGVLEAFDPDVVVLVVGTTELSDRRIGTTTLRVGTPEHDRRITRRLAEFAAVATSRGASVEIATPGCLDRSGAAPARVEHLRRLAASAPAITDVDGAFDWYAATCTGPEATENWTRTGLTRIGAERTWRRLADALR